jgi:hypothetical protein
MCISLEAARLLWKFEQGRELIMRVLVIMSKPGIFLVILPGYVPLSW